MPEPRDLSPTLKLSETMRHALQIIWDGGAISVDSMGYLKIRYPEQGRAARTIRHRVTWATMEALERRELIARSTTGDRRWGLTPVGERVGREMNRPTAEGLS